MAKDKKTTKKMSTIDARRAKRVPVVTKKKGK